MYFILLLFFLLLDAVSVCISKMSGVRFVVVSVFTVLLLTLLLLYF